MKSVRFSDFTTKLKFVSTRGGMKMGWQEGETVDRKLSQGYTLQQIIVWLLLWNIKSK